MDASWARSWSACRIPSVPLQCWRRHSRLTSINPAVAASRRQEVVMIKRVIPTILICLVTLILNVSAQPVAVPTETDKIVHLLNRAGYGPRPGDIEKVRQTGIDRYIDEQLRPEYIN